MLLHAPDQRSDRGPERSRRVGARAVQACRACNEEIRDLYRSATAVVLPGEEDFGIVPVEAQACGTPVVALARGGALDTIVDGETGVLVTEGTEQAMADGLRRAAAVTWDSTRIRAHAERFSRERFRREMSAIIEETVAAPPDQRW
ncbi:MAG: glycosyltransferase [Acidobacteria bacterium]|nr:glycosyltransferase [Acidobacteriota bacterium]